MYDVTVHKNNYVCYFCFALNLPYMSQGHNTVTCTLLKCRLLDKLIVFVHIGELLKFVIAYIALLKFL